MNKLVDSIKMCQTCTINEYYKIGGNNTKTYTTLYYLALWSHFKI